MNKRIFKQKFNMTAMFVVCVMITFGCNTVSKVNDDLLIEMGVNDDQLPLLQLKGSQWKLAGLYSSETERLTIPDENEECFTLTFFSDDRAQRGSQDKTCGYIPFHFLFFSNGELTKAIDGPHFIEGGFIVLFQNWWSKLHSYTISNSEMRLYLHESNDYLLYKRIKK